MTNNTTAQHEARDDHSLTPAESIGGKVVSSLCPGCEVGVGVCVQMVINIIRSGAVRWITGQAIRNAFPLIDANVVN